MESNESIYCLCSPSTFTIFSCTALVTLIDTHTIFNLSVPQHNLADMKAAAKGAQDPFELVEKDLSTLSGGIKDLLGSDHPVLESCAK